MEQSFKDSPNQTPFWADSSETPKHFLASTINTAENSYLKLTEVPYCLKHPSTYQSSQLMELSAKGLFPSVLNPSTNKFMYFLGRYWSFFKSGLKVYIPVHLVILLLKLRGRKEPLPTLLKKFIAGLIRSSLFVASFASSYAAGRSIPIFTNLFSNKLGSWSAFIISITFSFSIFLESSSRWNDISLYVLGQWLEGYGYSLVKRKYISNIPYLEKIVFAVAISLIISLHYSKETVLEDPSDQEKKKPSSKSQEKLSRIVKILLGDDNDDLYLEKQQLGNEKDKAKLSPTVSREAIDASL
jgi:hypothetical protein